MRSKVLANPIDGPILPLLMFGLMLGMGLSLTWTDFRRIAQVPTSIIVGTLLQLVAMPMAGLVIAQIYALPPLLMVGLVVCAACPGGLGSNVFVHFGRAHTALSISLTAIATLVTLLTLPLWVRVAQSSAGAQVDSVEVPLLATALELGGFTVLPILVGMGVRSIRPGAEKWERPITAFSGLGLFGVLVMDNLERPDPPTELFMMSLIPSLWLLGSAIVLGLGIPRLLGRSWADSVTIAVELCVKNVLLGMVVVATAFQQIDATIPLFAYSTLMAPPALVILAIYRFWPR
ncbi:bile acid:sodium symporter [Myxococcota bacterium]|nr:bile acid:sodium symporter [Myxococcota bacterium]